MGSYVPLNNAPTIAQVYEAPGQVSKEVDIIFLGCLNVRLQEPRDAREAGLVMAVRPEA